MAVLVIHHQSERHPAAAAAACLSEPGYHLDMCLNRVLGTSGLQLLTTAANTVVAGLAAVYSFVVTFFWDAIGSVHGTGLFPAQVARSLSYAVVHIEL